MMMLTLGRAHFNICTMFTNPPSPAEISEKSEKLTRLQARSLFLFQGASLPLGSSLARAGRDRFAPQLHHQEETRRGSNRERGQESAEIISVTIHPSLRTASVRHDSFITFLHFICLISLSVVTRRRPEETSVEIIPMSM